MINQISEWLTGNQAYAAGVALYSLYGRSTTLKTMFAHGETGFTRTKLLQALRDLAEEKIPEKVLQLSPEKQLPVAPLAPPKPENQSIRDQMRPLLDERTHLHQRLSLYDELNLLPAERKEIAFRILSLTRQITPLYLQLQTTIAPAPVATNHDFSQLSPVERIKLRSNLRSQLSKLKKKPNRAEEIPGLENQINQLTALIETPHE